MDEDPTTTATGPNPDHEKTTIKGMIETNESSGLVEGSFYYLIESTWWHHWQRFVQYNNQVVNFALNRPGPIDNSALVDEDGDLRPSVHESTHFFFLPKEAWEQLIEWYGGGPAVPRPCVRGWNDYLSIELKKMKLQIIWSRDPKKIVTRSFAKSTKIKIFLEEMRKEMKWNWKNIRVVDFYQARRAATLTSDRWNKSLEECQILDKQYILIEERKKDGTFPPDSVYSHLQVSNSYSYSSAPSPPGQTGLNNLGNTCFMNSSIQCLSSTACLTDFFLSNAYEKDINLTNPLGMKGEMAKEYRNLLAELWSSTVGTVAPRNMKGKIEKYAPQFGGYAQHDSQELLAFLLDGLHEDLNRLDKKPHVEVLPNWTAEEAWEGHKKRNDSIIVDMFQGQLKSRLRCPNNQKVSVVYDPFMYLTVPLPVDNSRKIIVTVYRMDPTIRPLRIGVTVNKAGVVKDIKNAIAEITSIPAQNLALVDVGNCKLFKEWQDFEETLEVGENDKVAAHEIVARPEKDAKQADKPTDQDNDHEMKDDKAEDEPAPIEYARIILYQQKQGTYSWDHDAFGTPLILSVPAKSTYRELYCFIVNHLSCGAADGEAGGIFKKTPSRNVIADGTTPPEGFTHNPVGFPDGTVFEMEYISGPGSYYQRLPACLNNDEPLGLPDRRVVQLVWLKKAYDEFIDLDKIERPEKEILLHQTSQKVPKSDAKEKDISLNDCLKLFNEEEQLSETDTWYCPDCKEHVRAFKKFTIWRAPPILVIHLKRFSYLGQMYRDRLDHLVQFPLEDLDLSEFLEGPKDFPLYDLYAVSNHYGSLGGGHYTAYAKSRNDSTWFEFDDQQVKTVGDTSQIISSAAYVLFYKRKDVIFTPFNEPGASNSDGSDDAKDDKEGGKEVEMKNQVIDEYEEPSDAEDGEAGPAGGAASAPAGLQESEETRIPESDLNN